LDGLSLCLDCGLEANSITYEAEWRKYSDADGRASKDTSRCNMYKSNAKSIDNVVEKLDLPEAIKADVQARYNKIANGKTFRGKCRAAVVATCLFYIYIHRGDFRTNDDVRQMFPNVQKKDMSQALTKYLSVFSEDRTFSMEPVHLLKRFMFLLNIDVSTYYDEIRKLFHYVKNRSQTLVHSNPQSVAAAIIYLYLLMNPKLMKRLKLTKALFAEKVSLSDITVTKLATEAKTIIESVLGKPCAQQDSDEEE
jgi:transcription initiation factor TFIIIB Brf1 subunit/transcription initiation factor TFIIB